MTRRKSLDRLCLLATAALVLGLPDAALAHGDIRDSSPEAGSKVARVPGAVRVTLAEPAADGSSLVVSDGCGRKVSADVEINREALGVPIAGGEPGRWLVELRSISAVDGHVVKEAFTFRVSGKKDCSEKDPTPGDDVDVSPDTSSRPPIENADDEGPSFPVVPFALGSLAVVAIALAARRPWNKS